MASDASRADHEQRSRASFRAGQWERSVADEFISWRLTAVDGSRQQLAAVCTAANKLLGVIGMDQGEREKIAVRLPSVLGECDKLTFDRADDAAAYMALHLADRYGRVVQVLTQAFRGGHLPLRKASLTVLDVGAGPAPSLYAAADFYRSLVLWSHEHQEHVSIAGVTHAHALDRGSAWDWMIHHFSEYLMEARVHAGLMSWESPVSGLPFGRTHNDLDDFSVHRAHHAERDQIARSIRHEADMYDEYISDHEAMSQAYASDVNQPSAYDIIVMCNFLTNSSMAEQLRAEVEQLGNSLTPGGVLLILGGVGRHYPAIYKQVHDLLTKRLLPVMDEEMEANDEPWARSLIACQQREAVEFLRQACDKGSWNKLQRKLPRDLLDSQLPFSLPRFRALLFKKETRTQAMTLRTRGSSKRAAGDAPTQGRT